jgi:hypothetical protein
LPIGFCKTKKRILPLGAKLAAVFPAIAAFRHFRAAL